MRKSKLTCKCPSFGVIIDVRTKNGAGGPVESLHLSVRLRVVSLREEFLNV